MKPMDSIIALAIMAKAQKVFEREETFLSFPILQPVAFTKEQLNYVSKADYDTTAEGRFAGSEFSKDVNLIPNGIIWPPAEPRYLWSVYDDVLNHATLASSERNPQEEMCSTGSVIKTALPWGF